MADLDPLQPGEFVPARIVRFVDGGWRKATCTVCWGLVHRGAIEAHARYHVGRDEGQEPRDGLWSSFNDVTVYDDHSTSTGWVTESTGPG